METFKAASGGRSRRSRQYVCLGEEHIDWSHVPDHCCYFWELPCKYYHCCALPAAPMWNFCRNFSNVYIELSNKTDESELMIQVAAYAAR